MKLDEYTKFKLTLFFIPWVPAYLLYKYGYKDIGVKVIVAFMCLALLCFASPKICKFLKDTTHKIGDFLGKYIAIIALSIVYICVVLPTGLLMKIVKRDRLKLKKPDTKTYWVDETQEKTDYEFQF